MSNVKDSGIINIDDNVQDLFESMYNKNNYFFFIIHGQSITPNQSNWQYIEKSIDFVQMFESHGKLRHPYVKELDANIQEIIINKTLMYDLTQTEIVETYKPNASNAFSLPPLAWVTNPLVDINTNYVELIGFYHFIYDHTNKSCTLNKKILNWHQLTQMGTITYSILFKQINLYLKKHPEYNTIPKSNSGLGIFSCRGINPVFAKAYSNNNSNTKTHFNTTDAISPHIPYNNINTVKSGYGFSLVSLNIPKRIINNQDTWIGALLDIKHQGCALNVLSYYDLLKTHYAREMTTCLDIKGTSIFKIVDFINNYFMQLQPPKPHTYLIMRFTKAMAINYLTEHFLYENTAVNNTCTIFKMYEKDAYKRGFSEIGHTIALMKIGSNVFLTDPQTMTFINIITNRAEFIKYLNPWNFFDLILVYLPITLNRRFYNDPLLTTGQIRYRPPNITFGGNQRKKHWFKTPVNVTFGGRRRRGYKTPTVRGKNSRYKTKHKKTKRKKTKHKNTTRKNTYPRKTKY